MQCIIKENVYNVLIIMHDNVTYFRCVTSNAVEIMNENCRNVSISHDMHT